MRFRALLMMCAVVVGFAAINRSAEPVTVTVRLIDARNGKPYTAWKGPLQLSLYRVDPAKGFRSRVEAEANSLGTARQVPDGKGEVRFDLPPPIPGIIHIDTPLGCSSRSFDTEEVVKKGAVGKNECRTEFTKLNAPIEAKPGELVYFVAPLSFWERHRIIR